MSIMPDLAVTRRLRSAAALLVAVAAGAPACSSSRDGGAWKEQNSYGSQMARKGFWREALFRYEKAAAQHPESAEIQNNLGVAYESVGETSYALAAYKRALELAPQDAKIKRNYARFAEYYTSVQRASSLPAPSSSSPAVRPSPPPPPATGAARPPARPTPRSSRRPSAPCPPARRPALRFRRPRRIHRPRLPRQRRFFPGHLRVRDETRRRRPKGRCSRRSRRARLGLLEAAEGGQAQTPSAPEARRDGARADLARTLSSRLEALRQEGRAALQGPRPRRRVPALPRQAARQTHEDDGRDDASGRAASDAEPQGARRGRRLLARRGRPYRGGPPADRGRGFPRREQVGLPQRGVPERHRRPDVLPPGARRVHGFHVRRDGRREIGR